MLVNSSDKKGLFLLGPTCMLSVKPQMKSLMIRLIRIPDFDFQNIHDQFPHLTGDISPPIAKQNANRSTCTRNLNENIKTYLIHLN